ncbi:hypothetical protein VTK73DRAFT_754 [Phialemonium thermophilum]|uniref:Uncharacterized protein n=1 Tax=Phialemonium thermophilum TaxID=223376 RepID=A0ABR3VUA6_9PEZI
MAGQLEQALLLGVLRDPRQRPCGPRVNLVLIFHFALLYAGRHLMETWRQQSPWIPYRQRYGNTLGGLQHVDLKGIVLFAHTHFPLVPFVYCPVWNPALKSICMKEDPREGSGDWISYRRHAWIGGEEPAGERMCELQALATGTGPWLPFSASDQTALGHIPNVS